MNVDKEQDRSSNEARIERAAIDPGTTRRTRPADRLEPHAALEVGDILENCRLVAKLGYGSSGQVFLAQEIFLGNRPIVLKISADGHDEHVNLARLHHTHIVPLFWARVLSPDNVRVLAMPYLAKTTLADLLRHLETAPIATWTGARVRAMLHADQDQLPVRIAVEDHQTQTLGQTTWVEFVVRMGKTLAEALAYAHGRNLLHLDVKPANIVLTPDGQPILLDLDVARAPLAAGDAVVPWLGGTPAYMSPEQRAAMAALKKDEPIPQALDGRSDLYSLGLVLYQALGGTCDECHRPAPRQLPRLNPNVRPELIDIIAHCVAEDPTRRYPDCQALAEDLDRHLRRTQAKTALVAGQRWLHKGQHEANRRRFLPGKDLLRSGANMRAWAS